MNVNEMIKLLLTMPGDMPIVIQTDRGVTENWQLVWDRDNVAMVEVFE